MFVHKKLYIHNCAQIDTMSKGYKTIGIRLDVYEKLKKLSEGNKKSFSDVIEELLDGSKQVQETNTDAIRRIVDEIFSEKMKELESMLYNIVKKALSEKSKPQEQKKNFIEVVKDAFLGKRDSLKMQKIPIEISKCNIFLKGVKELDFDLTKYKAKAIEEPNENGEIIGLSIVPDIGFENISLEDWFDNYGAKLIKELFNKLSKP